MQLIHCFSFDQVQLQRVLIRDSFESKGQNSGIDERIGHQVAKTTQLGQLLQVHKEGHDSDGNDGNPSSFDGYFLDRVNLLENAKEQAILCIAV